MLLLFLPRVLVFRRGHLVRVDWRSVLRLLRRSSVLLLLRVRGLGVMRGGELFVGFFVFVVFVAFVGGEGEHGWFEGIDWFGG